MATGGRLYITALRTLDRLEIQYVPPELAVKRNPLIAGVAIVGRNNPQHHYLGGSTELNLQLDFHSQETNREDVIKIFKINSIIDGRDYDFFENYCKKYCEVTDWKSLDYRFRILPGKEFISTLNRLLQNKYKISISYTHIINNYMA